MQSYFITSSGTEIGKTFITCAIAHQLTQRSIAVAPLKPVISGWDDQDGTSDTVQLLRAAEQPVAPASIDAITPWRFAAPLSPNMAAEREGKTLDMKEIASFCQQPKKADICLIEGAGGVMVPLNATHTFLDLAEALAYPTILVVGSYLGTISHTLTAHHALSHRGIPVHAVIVNETENSTVSLEETCHTLSHFIDSPVISVPYIRGNKTTPWVDCPPLIDALRLA